MSIIQLLANQYTVIMMEITQMVKENSPNKRYPGDG